jgi:hypothetical protein
MKYSLFDDSPVAKMLHDDPFEQRRSDRRVPHALRIHDDDWPIAAHAKARRLPAFHPIRPKEESFALKE